MAGVAACTLPIGGGGGWSHRQQLGVPLTQKRGAVKVLDHRAFQEIQDSGLRAYAYLDHVDGEVPVKVQLLEEAKRAAVVLLCQKHAVAGTIGIQVVGQEVWVVLPVRECVSSMRGG
jgi:hypothetical protein